jgi:S-adenosylmethionine uptake transporter
MAAIAEKLTGKNMLVAGILLMLLGDFMFALNDAMGKWLVASLSVGQILFVRSVGAFLVLGPMMVRNGPSLLFSRDRPVAQVIRAFLAGLETCLFYAAVVHLPLADVMSFYMAGPIYVAVLSHFFLGEHVGWRRWSAILIGFVGVLIILKPGAAGLGIGSLIALAGSFSFAVIIVMTRVLRGVSDTSLVTWQTVASLVIGAFMMVGAYTPASTLQVGSMVLLGVVACVAHLLITRALKLAPASALAPLHYTLLLWAVVFGFVFFGDIPGPRVLIGSALVVLAGLFIFHRQKTVDTVPTESVPKGVN